MKKPAAPRKTREAAKPKAAKAARQKEAATRPNTTPRAAPTPPGKEEPGRVEAEKPLSAAQERFAQFIALGAEQAKAYREANPGTRAKPESVWTEASKWAALPKVRQRVDELRAAARAKLTEDFTYELVDAMREAEEARQVAAMMLDSSAMSKAIDLKAKLTGLHVDPRKNARDPFEGKSDDDLVAAAEAARAELARAGALPH